MTNEEQKKIFAKNLNKYMKLNNKQQIDVAKELGINPTTLNMWCKGNSLPSTGKIRALADYFRIGMTDLTDLKEDVDVDSEYSNIAMKIGLYDEKFKRIIIAYSKMSSDEKDLICNFFERFIL